MAYDLEKVDDGSVKRVKNSDTIAKFEKRTTDFAAKSMLPLLILERESSKVEYDLRGRQSQQKNEKLARVVYVREDCTILQL